LTSLEKLSHHIENSLPDIKKEENIKKQNCNISQEIVKNNIPQENVLEKSFSWAEAALKKPILDQIEIMQEKEAEIEKQRIYREELDMQRRLDKLKKFISKNEERDMENELLIKQSNLLKYKMREPQPSFYKNLRESNIACKVAFNNAQKYHIIRDTNKISREYQKTLEDHKISELYSRKKSVPISKAIQQVYENPETPRNMNNSTENIWTTPSYARVPYSKLETLRYGINSLENKFFEKLDHPTHQTRRHFRCAGTINNTNMWEYDPRPEIRAAGIAARTPAYNIIDGRPRGILNKSFEISQVRNKCEVLPFLKDRDNSAIYQRNRMHNQSSIVLNH